MLSSAKSWIMLAGLRDSFHLPSTLKLGVLPFFACLDLNVFCGIVEWNGWRVAWAAFGRHQCDSDGEYFLDYLLSIPKPFWSKHYACAPLTRIKCAQRERLHALKHTQNSFHRIRPCLPSQIPFQRTTTGLSENKASRHITIEGSLDLYYILINFPGDSQETDHF